MSHPVLARMLRLVQYAFCILVALFLVVPILAIIPISFSSGPAQRTLPRQMFDGIRDNIDPSILAMSTLLVGVSVIMLTSVGLLSRRTPGKAG